MASVLNSAPRVGTLPVAPEALRYSPVCIECESDATVSVRRWSGLRTGFVPVRMCDGHATSLHRRSALLSILVVVAGLVGCLTAMLGMTQIALGASGTALVLALMGPRFMRSRVRSRGGSLAISGASVAFARNNRRGVRADRGDILDGWFTVEQFEDLAEVRAEAQPTDGIRIPRQRQS